MNAAGPLGPGPGAWTTGAGDPLHRAPIVGYLRAIRAHWLLCLTIVLAALVGSAAWLAQRTPSYVAYAGLLVNPIPETDTTLAGLPLIRASGGDPERPVKTGASLMSSAAVADRTSELIGGELSPEQVDAATEVNPEEGQNLITVEASTDDAELSARTANAYVRATLDVRRETLEPLVADAIAATREELRSLPGADNPRAGELRTRLADLRTIADGRDPTLSIAEQATAPSEPEGEPAWLVLALALASGIAIAMAIAILIELLVPGPISDEEELQAILPAPIIARLPRLGGRRPRSPLGTMPTGVSEGYRTLRGQLEFRSRSRGRAGNGKAGPGGVIAIASPSRGDGRTAVAVGLARAMVAARASSLLVEANLHAPDLGAQLEIEPELNVTALLDSSAAPGAAVTPVPGVPGLGAVVAPRVDNLRTAEQLGAELPRIFALARRLADCVVVDTPPLAFASDVLPVLSAADQFVLVVRLRHTRRSDLIAAAELLAQRGLVPAGVVVVGSPYVDPGERRSTGLDAPVGIRDRDPA